MSDFQRSERFENRFRGLLKKPRLVSKVPAPLRCWLKQPGRASGGQVEKILYHPRSSALSPSLPRHTALRASGRGRLSPTGTLQASESRQHCVAPYFGRRSRLGESAHPSGSPLAPQRIRSRLRSLLGESACSSENPLTPPLTPRRVLRRLRSRCWGP